MSMQMDPKDQALLDKSLFENQDDTIRRSLISKYNTYYRHWQDLNLLVALFAMIGLATSIMEWETQFEHRGPDGRSFTAVSYFTDVFVFLISILGCVAIILKYYFESVWYDFKNPVAFYKIIVQRQVEAGMIDPEDLTENFKTKLPIVWMMKQYTFWLELLLMMVVPLPFKIRGK